MCVKNNVAFPTFFFCYFVFFFSFPACFFFRFFVFFCFFPTRQLIKLSVWEFIPHNWFFCFFPKLTSFFFNFFCVFFSKLSLLILFFYYWTDWEFSFIVFFFETLTIATVFPHMVFVLLQCFPHVFFSKIIFVEFIFLILRWLRI
jgi:hypothetical protein